MPSINANSTNALDKFHSERTVVRFIYNPRPLLIRDYFVKLFLVKLQVEETSVRTKHAYYFFKVSDIF